MGLLEYYFFILGILFYCLRPCLSFLTIKNGNWLLRNNILREKKSKLRLHLISSKVSENDLKIVIYPNPILRQKSEEVIYFDDNLKVKSKWTIIYARICIYISMNNAYTFFLEFDKKNV